MSSGKAPDWYPDKLDELVSCTIKISGKNCRRNFSKPVYFNRPSVATSNVPFNSPRVKGIGNRTTNCQGMVCDFDWQSDFPVQFLKK